VVIYTIGGKFYEVVIYALTLGREERLKRHAIARLGIKPGDTVLEWGCGTGIALKHVIPRLEGKGRVFALDVSPKMMQVAVGRFWPTPACELHYILRLGHTLNLPVQVDVAIASYALGVAGIADYVPVLESIAQHLREGGRFLLIDQYVPEARNSYARLRNAAHMFVGSKLFHQDFSPGLMTAVQQVFTTVHLEFYPHLLAYAWIGVKK